MVSLIPTRDSPRERILGAEDDPLWLVHSAGALFSMPAYVRLLARLAGTEAPPDTLVRFAWRIDARIVAGAYWCTCPDCERHTRVSRRDTRFWCICCRNRRHFFAPAVVDFPVNLPVIERLLVLRPVEARNWEPGETVAELIADNKAHGLGGADALD